MLNNKKTHSFQSAALLLISAVCDTRVEFLLWWCFEGRRPRWKCSCSCSFSQPVRRWWWWCYAGTPNCKTVSHRFFCLVWTRWIRNSDVTIRRFGNLQKLLHSFWVGARFVPYLDIPLFDMSSSNTTQSKLVNNRKGN